MAINYITLTSDGGEERWNLATGTYQRYADGQLVEERPFSTDDTAWRTAIQGLDALDSADLLTKLRNALATDRTYLAKVAAGTATNADHSAQVAALTRQMTAVLLRSVLYTR